MLSSQDVHRIAGQLRSVDQESRQHHENLGSLLQDFQSLLRSYHALKNDYAEEKEAHGKHKKISRDYERNPFVLVLVDGDNYLFHEHLIKDRSEGGITAARLLTDGIKDVLHDRLGDQAVQCRVVIRIYANLLGLSKALARAGLAGNEARSFAGFASSFTRSQDLADYTDAGDKKEAADHKIRELFRLFIDINQCKHIFFAGCHDTGYLSLLTPYRGMADRITLLKAASFHKDFTSLGLSIAELPSVFMPTSISNGVAATSTSKPAVCWFFQKGICKHGSECIKQHVMPQQQITVPQTADTHTQPQSSSISSSEPKRYYLGGISVPMNKPMPENCIAVNQDGDHLDVHIPQPSNEEWTKYTQHTKKHKPCNRYHLGGECGDLSCEYDHSDIDDVSLKVMRYIMLQYPCPRGPRCDNDKCYLGHFCQRPGCTGQKPCRFNSYAHRDDGKTDELDIAWV